MSRTVSAIRNIEAMVSCNSCELMPEIRFRREYLQPPNLNSAICVISEKAHRLITARCLSKQDTGIMKRRKIISPHSKIIG
jgi:hypothetical protein